jgi:5'(3')-deoxyribonucleotidase
MEKLKVFIDIDNTLNNIFDGFWNCLMRDFNIDIPVLGHEDYVSFDFEYYLEKYFSEIAAEDRETYIRRCLKSFKFFYNLPVLPYVEEELEKLNREVDIWILTKPVRHQYHTIMDKLLWVDKYLPFIGGDKTICIHNKGMFQSFSFLIDDDFRNLQAFRGKTIRMDYPYNRKYAYKNNIGVLNNWQDGCNRVMTMIDHYMMGD